MESSNLQRYRRLLIAAIVGLSIVLVVINIEWFSSFDKILSGTSLRGDVFSQYNDAMSVKIEPGSGAFYALPEIRDKLVDETLAIANELKLALIASNSTTAVDGQTSRGIIVFLPLNETKFNKELKALFLSIAVMRTFQPANFKTDIIVGTPRSGFAFPESLGCVETKRSDFQDPERCIIVEHVALKDRSGPVHPLVSYSNYIDSMLVLSEFHNPEGYTILMRSDLDTFLTPGFGKWSLPDKLVMVAGRGGYGSENANRHLSWVMTSKLHLLDEGLKGVGSTWVGKSLVMVATAKLTVSSMIWLHTQEFSEYEKKHSGTDGWPYWHWPVLLLYGGHIAINQIPINSVFVTNSENDIRLDYGTTTNTTMTENVLHVHCWHTDDFFSKFRFSMGQYSRLDLGPFLAMNTTSSYAATIAVSSDRLAAKEFSEIVNDQSKMRDNLWIRQEHKS